MATLETRSGVRGTKYRLIFFLNGKRYAETLAVETEQDAQTVKRNAERTLAMIAEGHKEIPAGADVGLWIATGGKLTRQPTTANTLPLGELFDEYLKGNPDGHLEDSTLLTMRIHLKHAATVLGKNTPLGSLTFDDLQNYINRRTKDKNRQGNKISPVTVRKEVNTISGMWSWAASHGKVKSGFPGKKLKYPSTKEATRFQTWHEIDRQVKNGGDESLWDSLFLSPDEVEKLLKHIEKHGVSPGLR